VQLSRARLTRIEDFGAQTTGKIALPQVLIGAFFDDADPMIASVG
jgi:hypothetical protein